MTEEIKTLESTENEEPKKKGVSAKTITIIIVVALMFIIPLLVYLWKQSEIKDLKKKYDTNITEITAQANAAIDENNKRNMETITRVFSWAVRSEMLRENLEQVDTYMTDLVKNAGMNNISAINADGIVIKSTNKKFEGKIYPGPIANELAQINEVVSKTDENGDIISLCPIMGIDKRLGTVIISYSPVQGSFVAQESK